MKKYCTNNSSNHVTDFYCHNCHGMSHNAIDCRKPKYDNDRRNSRMSRYTKPGYRKRSYEDRRQIMCYKCNNLGHIAQNCHVPNWSSSQ